MAEEIAHRHVFDCQQLVTYLLVIQVDKVSAVQLGIGLLEHVATMHAQFRLVDLDKTLAEHLFVAEPLVDRIFQIGYFIVKSHNYFG